MKETITKHFFSPTWKCDKIEAELEKLEKDGWRLNKISGFRKFQFVKSPPKETKYLHTYHLARDNTRGMMDTEYLLKKEHQAAKIDGNFIEGLKTTYIYRITKDVNLKEQKSLRNLYLQHLVLQYILISLSFVVLSAGGVIFSFKPSLHIATLLCFTSVGIIGLSILIYNLIGLMYLRKQHKAYLETNKI